MSSSDSDQSEGNISPKRKRITPPSPSTSRKRQQLKKSKQKYSKGWEELPALKGWIKKESDFLARCVYCHKNIICELSTLKRHANSEKHKKNAIKTQPPKIVSLFTGKPSPVDKSVKRLEIKLSAFFAEHNIAFSAADHLTDLIKTSVTDSKIVEGFSLKRTKTKCIVKNVIGASQKHVLVNKLRTVKFSILTDKSTDIGTSKNSCVVVRYYDHEYGSIRSHFFDLSPVFSTGEYDKVNEGATGQNLFTSIMKAFDFENNSIPKENVIGFGSDGCNVMMGKNNSVASRFKSEFPGLVVWTCICHSLHLCASEACKVLPRSCEELARNIVNYFKASAKRCTEFAEFQEFLDVEVHKLLHPSQTRWLSLHAVVVRLLEQWDALKLYFQGKFLGDRLLSVENIYTSLNDPLLKLIYLFLEWILPKFNNLNSYFQSDKVVLPYLHDKICSTYKDLLMSYMKSEYVNSTPLGNIMPNENKFFIQKNSNYVGIKAMTFVQQQQNQLLITDFYSRVQEFMITLCVQFKKRYDFSEALMPLLKSFCPKNALGLKFRETGPSLYPVINHLPRITTSLDLSQRIDDEWRMLPQCNLPKEIKEEALPDIFWHKLRTFRQLDGIIPFASLCDFALMALSLPHSNAECERIFSKCNLVKTKIRNKINLPTLNGIILASGAVKVPGTSCVNFEPSKDMYNRMNKTMYNNDDDKEADLCFEE